jgi:hypothetical protein
MNKTYSRREFAKTLLGAGVAATLLPHIAWALPNKIDPKVARLVARTIGIDAHNHIDVPMLAQEMAGYNVPLAAELQKSGLTAISMTFAVDYVKLTEEGQAYQRFLNGLEVMDNILKANGMTRALTLADIKKAHKQKKPTVIQSVEGAHFLEGKIERLQVAYDRGLRHLTLLHDNDASVPLGDVFTNPPQWGGLTDFGAEVIKECERLGILVDLAHAANKTVDMALEVATKPIIFSHTSSNKSLSNNEMLNKMMMPRLMSDEQAKKIAQKGGVIGVWANLAESPLAYAQNIKTLADIVGVDHIAIGTDSKLTPEYNSPNEVRPLPELPKDGEKGKGDFPKNDKHLKKGKTTNALWEGETDGFYYTVVDALLKVGFSERDITKIGGENYGRIFDVTTKK